MFKKLLREACEAEYMCFFQSVVIPEFPQQTVTQFFLKVPFFFHSYENETGWLQSVTQPVSFSFSHNKLESWLLH